MKSNPVFKNLVIHAIDVGARGGLSEHWSSYAEILSVDMLEPDTSDYEEQLKKGVPGLNWFNIALAKESGKKNLHILKRPSGSSFYPPNWKDYGDLFTEDYHTLDRTVELDCLSFADFINNYNRPNFDLVKLDTQGSELEILSSLTDEQFGDILAIETEVEFVPLYEGQPLFVDVDNFLREKGLDLFDLRTHRVYYTDQKENNIYLKKYLNYTGASYQLGARLVAGDGLYFRNIESLIKLKKPDQIKKMVVISAMYSYFDYGLYLLERVSSEDILPQEEIKGLREWLIDMSPKPALHERNDGMGFLVRKLMRKLRLPIQKPQLFFWGERSAPDQ